MEKSEPATCSGRSRLTMVSLRPAASAEVVSACGLRRETDMKYTQRPEKIHCIS